MANGSMNVNVGICENCGRPLNETENGRRCYVVERHPEPKPVCCSPDCAKLAYRDYLEARNGLLVEQCRVVSYVV